ncbi:MAG: integrin alpha [Pseudomonadales bacterium]
MRKWGELKKDNFGISVANAGDVNNDGIDDVVVGAHLWDKPLPPSTKKLKSTGRVYVYSGRDGSELFSTAPLAGQNSNDWFGYSVAGADVNGDGYSDILVGAPRWDVPAAGAQKALKDAGKVYVFNGQTGDLMASVQGTAAGDNLGWAVANAGDTNNDGTADVVIGAPKADIAVPASKPIKDAGRALVCSGADLAAAIDPTANACNEITALFEVSVGAAAGDNLGSAVAGAGDVDGDGYDDVVIGLPKADVNGKKDAGAAVVYSGATRAEWARAEGENAGDWFGYSVAGAGDLNGDTKADIVVGAYRHAATVSVNGKNKLLKQAGAVYRYSCVSTGACVAIGQKTEGEAAGDRLGWSVAGGGDIDNDGQLDVIAGAPGRDRTLPPVPPKTKGKVLKDAGAVYLLDGATGASDLAPILGVRAKDNRGLYLANGGDVNLDGYSDIITSAPKADTQMWAQKNPAKPAKLTNIKDVGFVEIISGRIASGN